MHLVNLAAEELSVYNRVVSEKRECRSGLVMSEKLMSTDEQIQKLNELSRMAKEAINYPNIRYHENTDYENNNILKSLFYAESEMDEEFIFSYSDIMFEQGILEKLLQSKVDISLVIDIDWLAVQ